MDAEMPCAAIPHDVIVGVGANTVSPPRTHTPSSDLICATNAPFGSVLDNAGSWACQIKGEDT